MRNVHVLSLLGVERGEEESGLGVFKQVELGVVEREMNTVRKENDIEVEGVSLRTEVVARVYEE